MGLKETWPIPPCGPQSFKQFINHVLRTKEVGSLIQLVLEFRLTRDYSILARRQATSVDRSRGDSDTGQLLGKLV